jgi:hypothetical protein
MAVLGLVAVLTATVLTGCAAGRPATRTTLGAASCGPASPIRSDPSLGPEVEGTGHQATLYGLIMVTSAMPVRVGEDVKIVWRMTGSGPLQLSATNPLGKVVPLTWGPEPHGGSDFARPGDECGAGYAFAVPGCWDLHAQRTTGSADVWLSVRSK